MKRCMFWQFVLCGLILVGQSARATEIGLADWCVNINGNYNASNACNGGSGASLSSVASSIDATLEPAANGLGSATQTETITLSPGNNFVAFYADNDVDYLSYGSFDDYGTVNNVGSLLANESYYLDDPNVSNINGSSLTGYSNSVALPDQNNVAVGGGPPNQCCDVAWALGISNINVLAGGTGTVTFTESLSAPRTGFYLQQTNNDTGDSIYLSAAVSVTNPTSSTPEPSTFVLGLGVLGLVALVRRNRAAVAGC